MRVEFLQTQASDFKTCFTILSLGLKDENVFILVC